MNRPTTVEILQALAQHLSAVVQPRLSGAEAYQNRVALNLLHILERELTLGVPLAEEERARLCTLTGHDTDLATLNTRLCAMIAAGDLGASDKALMDHLRRSACAKLTIDNPHYPTYQRLLETSPTVT